jgi:hypothetical protein
MADCGAPCVAVVEERDPIDRGVEEEEPDGVEGLQSKVVVERRRSGEEVVRHFRERGSRRSGTARRLRTSRPRINNGNGKPKKKIACAPDAAAVARRPPATAEVEDAVRRGARHG